jgi:excisionase family DNA binding protein
MYDELERGRSSRVAEQTWLSVHDIVQKLGVHEQTVRRWIKSGDLTAYLLGDRAGYRIAAADLQAFMDRRRVRPPTTAARKRTA